MLFTCQLGNLERHHALFSLFFLNIVHCCSCCSVAVTNSNNQVTFCGRGTARYKPHKLGARLVVELRGDVEALGLGEDVTG